MAIPAPASQAEIAENGNQIRSIQFCVADRTMGSRKNNGLFFGNPVDTYIEKAPHQQTGYKNNYRKQCFHFYRPTILGCPPLFAHRVSSHDYCMVCIISIMGRYMAITIKPITTAIRISMTGSSMVVIF